MFKRKNKEVVAQQESETKVMPPPYRIMVRQYRDDGWVWSVQVRMPSMDSHYYKSLADPNASGRSKSKEGAYNDAKAAYCEYEKRDRWRRETEYFTPTSEWCK